MPSCKDFSSRIIKTIGDIPMGKVATYGQIAGICGNPRGARAVAWLLHSSSKKHSLPWHRVINRKGEISLPSGFGFEEQKLKLEMEGVIFGHKDRIDLKQFLWNPEGMAK